MQHAYFEAVLAVKEQTDELMQKNRRKRIEQEIKDSSAEEVEVLLQVCQQLLSSNENMCLKKQASF